MSLTNALLSGIEINQNYGTVKIPLSTTKAYQEFYLPGDIERGSVGSEVRVPEITGFAVCLDVAEGTGSTVTLGWSLEREFFGVGWVPVANGLTVGSQAEGDRVWFDIYFDSLVTVDPAALADKFRISITGTNDTSVWVGSSAGYVTAYYEGGAVLSGTRAIAFRLFTASGDSGVDFLGNPYRHVLFQHSINNVSTDGDEDTYWFSKPNPSRFAIENLYFDISENGAPGVVDSVLVDPITPDVYFHIYYSSEGSPSTTPEGWNDKLWTRVPSTFQAKTRETHVLPEPVSARYMKIEFSHLQAKPYNPGAFQQPIKYQKHPKWVLDYFLARLAEEDATRERFVSQRTEVRYNAIDLAYNYYLDDLKQEPNQPVRLSVSQFDQLRSFFDQRTDTSDRLDSATIQQINTVMRPYADGLAGFNAFPGAQALEETPRFAATSSVSTLNRDEVVFEQSYPVMFFYLTARHRYREVLASLSHDRAYFVGIRQVAFLRERYTRATDTNMYIEIGGDSINLASSDFVRQDNALVISDNG